MILQYNPFRVGPTDLSKVLIQAFIHLGPRDLSKVLIYAFTHLHTFQIRSSQSSFSMGFFTSQHFGFPFLRCKKPFHFARFPYQPSEPWIPGPCDAPKLRRLTGNIHLNGWGSAAVGPQTQQITVFCQAGPENFGHHDHGFSEGPWWKLVGCSHCQHARNTPAKWRMSQFYCLEMRTSKF